MQCRVDSGAGAGLISRQSVAARRRPRTLNPFGPVKLITAVIRPERLPEVKAALFRARVSGHGGERDVIQRYRAETVVLEFHEKVKIEMACSEPSVEPCIQAILSA